MRHQVTERSPPAKETSYLTTRRWRNYRPSLGAWPPFQQSALLSGRRCVRSLALGCWTWGRTLRRRRNLRWHLGRRLRRRGNLNPALGFHFHFDCRGDLTMKSDGHIIFAEYFEWTVQLDFAPVSAVALACQLFRDVDSGDRTEEIAVFAHFPRKGHGDAVHVLRQFFGLRLFLGLELQKFQTALLHPLPSLRCGRDRHFLGQQVISRVPVRHFDDLAPRAQLFDVFNQNHFHGSPQSPLLAMVMVARRPVWFCPACRSPAGWQATLIQVTG